MVSVGERLGLTRQPDFNLVTEDDGQTRVTRTSIFTGNRNTMVLPVQMADIYGWRQSGALIQDVFPQLNADQREFLISGATPEEWSGMFGVSDEED